MRRGNKHIKLRRGEEGKDIGVYTVEIGAVGVEND